MGVFEHGSFRTCFSQTSWGHPSAPGQDNSPHKEDSGGLKTPAALRRWAYGRAHSLTGYQSAWVLKATTGSSQRKKMQLCLRQPLMIDPVGICGPAYILLNGRLTVIGSINTG